MLIVTIPQLHSLNPLQLRRAVKEYRHEVDEPRMSEECSQYLQQLVRDWDRKRVREGVEGIQREVSQRQALRSSVTSDSTRSDRSSVYENSAAGLDALFDLDIGLSEYQPSIPPPSATELEDSRYIIPLAIPSQRYLGAVPRPRSHSQSLLYHGGQNRSDGRPPSPCSHSSSRPMAHSIRSLRRLQRRPKDYIKWLSTHTQHSSHAIVTSKDNGAKPSKPSRFPLSEINVNLPNPAKILSYGNGNGLTSGDDWPSSPHQTVTLRNLSLNEDGSSAPTTATITGRSWLSGFAKGRNPSGAVSQDGSGDEAETPSAENAMTKSSLWGQ